MITAKLILTAFLVLSQAAGIADATSTPALSPEMVAAHHSLEGRPECSPFRWEGSQHGEPRGAITVPVQIEDRTRWFQFDTGADTTMIYGTAADEAGWTTSSQHAFRPRHFAIGGVTFDRPSVAVAREMTDDGVAGTLGLPLLVGRITVIDYPGRRLCFFHPADAPKAIWSGKFVGGALRDGKLFVGLNSDTFSSDAIVLDTGSSSMALSVDGATWRRIMQKPSTVGAPLAMDGSAWGKPIHFVGAKSRQPFRMGDAALGQLEIFTNPEQPGALASWPFRADGIIGNAALWDGILVIDLSGRIDVGLIS